MAIEAPAPIALEIPVRSQNVGEVALERHAHLHARAGSGTSAGDAAVINTNSSCGSGLGVRLWRRTEAVSCDVGSRLGFVFKGRIRGVQRIIGPGEDIAASGGGVLGDQLRPVSDAQVAIGAANFQDGGSGGDRHNAGRGHGRLLAGPSSGGLGLRVTYI